MSKKWLDPKDQVNFKICDVTTWLTNNYIHLFPNISQSKSNQIMKIGHVIEYNNRNVFLQKSCKKRGRETSFQTSFYFSKNFV